MHLSAYKHVWLSMGENIDQTQAGQRLPRGAVKSQLLEIITRAELGQSTVLQAGPVLSSRWITHLGVPSNPRHCVVSWSAWFL